MKACVIGLGAMGRNHARVCSELSGVRLVGLADPSEDARARFSPTPSKNIYADYREMLDVEKPDFVTVSAPTEQHRSVACDVMARGIHVLVEKPIASTLEDADAMITASVKHGVNLMVGHVERFNPAVTELKRRIAKGDVGRIFQLHARRLSPLPARVQDVGVILDLATHDIDAMLYLIGSPVTRVFAETAQCAHEKREDMLSGLLRFGSGEIGVLDVHWLSPQKLRQLTIVGEGGVLAADYLAQDVYWYKNGSENNSWHPATNFSGAVEGDVVKTYIPKKEPLRVEYEAWVASVRDNLPSPVPGEEGRAVLDIALRLIASGAEGRSPARL